MNITVYWYQTYDSAYQWHTCGMNVTVYWYHIYDSTYESLMCGINISVYWRHTSIHSAVFGFTNQWWVSTHHRLLTSHVWHNIWMTHVWHDHHCVLMSHIWLNIWMTHVWHENHCVSDVKEKKNSLITGSWSQRQHCVLMWNIALNIWRTHVWHDHHCLVMSRKKKLTYHWFVKPKTALCIDVKYSTQHMNDTCVYWRQPYEWVMTH